MDSSSLMRAIAYDYPEDRLTRILKPANPAAGGALTIAVPGEAVWRPLSLIVTYTASAVAGNRLPRLVITDQTDTLGIVRNANTFPANNVSVVSFFGGGDAFQGAAGDTIFTNPMPDIVLLPGYTIGLATAAADAGDQISGVTLWVDEMLTQPLGVREDVRAMLMTRLLAESPSLGGN